MTASKPAAATDESKSKPSHATQGIYAGCLSYCDLPYFRIPGLQLLHMLDECTEYRFRIGSEYTGSHTLNSYITKNLQLLQIPVRSNAVREIVQ